jgi:hypothetical protein
MPNSLAQIKTDDHKSWFNKEKFTSGFQMQKQNAY